MAGAADGNQARRGDSTVGEAVGALWESLPGPARAVVLSILVGVGPPSLLITRLGWEGSIVALVALALCGMVGAALSLLVRALYHWGDRHYHRYPDTRRRLGPDLRLALCWLVAGCALAAFAISGASMAVVASIGAVLSAGYAWRAHYRALVLAHIEQRRLMTSSTARVARSRRVRELAELAEHSEDDLPLRRLLQLLFGRLRGVGKISAYLTYTVVVGYAAAVLFASAATAALLIEIAPEPGTRGGVGDSRESSPRDELERSGAGKGAPGRDRDGSESRPTYEELCPDLPGPPSIGRGLGALFYGMAVKAGCGWAARLVRSDGDVWVSEGWCGDELRSLAVVSDGHSPVLLYGEAARFAAAKAALGELLYAESSRAGDGLSIVATAIGNFAILQPTIDVGTAVSCDQVAMPTDFARLAPSIAELWRQQVVAARAWLQPVPDPVAGRGVLAFLAPDGSVAARGRCSSDTHCSLRDGDGELSTWQGAAAVTLADFTPWMTNAAP